MTAGDATQLPPNWPPDIHYTSQLLYTSAVAASSRLGRLHTPTAPTAAWPKVANPPTPCPHVAITHITAPAHPASGQFGLFALAHLPADSFILPYIGRVHLNDPADTDEQSDYDLALDREIGVSIDAASAGNEARFINDYRGIAAAPNAEFRDCWVRMDEGCARRWERRVGVFVLSAGKAGKRRAGIKPGEEILINYGRAFWRERRQDEDQDDESAAIRQEEHPSAARTAPP